MSAKPLKRKAKAKAKTPEQLEAERLAEEEAKRAARQVIVDAVCKRVAGGESVRQILLTEGMPSRDTWYSWVATDEGVADQYARACEARAELHAEELLEIADDGTNDWMRSNAPNNPGWVANGEHIQRSKLRYEARRWLMGKMKPKKYGDKVQAEVSGPDGGPIQGQVQVVPGLDPYEAYRLLKAGGKLAEEK